MKYRVLAVIAILLTILSLTVGAVNYDYDISLNSNFVSARYGDDLGAIAEKLNMTTDELNGYFSQNNLLFLAVSDDAKTQIKLSAFTDNFSSAVYDIANLDQSGLEEFKTAVGSDNENTFYSQSSDGRKFIAVKSTLQDSGGIYTVTQYITICDSKTFYLSCYNEGDDTSPEIETAFKSFSLKTVQSETQNADFTLIFIILGIALFAVIAIVMIIGIIKQNFSKEN